MKYTPSIYAYLLWSIKLLGSRGVAWRCGYIRETPSCRPQQALLNMDQQISSLMSNIVQQTNCVNTCRYGPTFNRDDDFGVCVIREGRGALGEVLPTTSSSAERATCITKYILHVAAEMVHSLSTDTFVSASCWRWPLHSSS